MKPIRILNMFTIMNVGGAETMVMNYYRNIDRDKVQFDFLVHRSQRGAYDDEIEALGGKIYRMMPIYPKNFSAYKKQLDRFFDEHPEYKIIHSHMSELGYFAFKSAEAHGVPTRICHAHNAPVGFDLKMIMRNYFKRKMIPHITDMFMCSEAAGEWLFGEKNKDKFTQMNNAIDAQKYSYNELKRQEIRNSLNIGDELVFGHVGRFSPQKNHPFLIDIFSKIKQIEPTAKLLLVGGGSGQGEIEAKVKSLGLQNDVIFTGVRSDVNDLMQAMDVFVMPSLFEGLPVTMVEAQASGLPCLISERVPIECKKTDLVHQMSLNDSPQKWAERAVSLANTPRTDRYEEIKNAGYDIKSAAKRLEEFYIERAK